MKDAQGHDYNELIEIQALHLKLWKERIRPGLFLEVKTYVLAMNQPAPKAEDKHQVFRGQTLIELFRTWPDIGPCFPTPPSAPQPEVNSTTDCL